MVLLPGWLAISRALEVVLSDPDREGRAAAQDYAGEVLPRAVGGRHATVAELQAAATQYLRAKPSCKLPERSAGRSRGYLGVDLHRDRDLAVPEDLHRHARMHLKGRLRRRWLSHAH